MINFLVFNVRYSDVEIALYRDQSCAKKIVTSTKKISSEILYIIEDIVKTHNIKFNELSFICANQGPAPFTSLRVVLTTINGINYSTSIPLIGINGLEALLKESKSQYITVGLLNAFCQGPVEGW